VLKKFFHPDDVTMIQQEAIGVFENQFDRFGYKGTILEKMKFLFTLQEQTFINCGKHAQHLVNLWKLSLGERVIGLLRQVGIQFPNVCTRPVLMFNHPDLAKEKIYHTMDAHQDWPSMQGSSNAAVLWVPLVNMEEGIGALEVIPGSHKGGIRTKETVNGFAMYDLKGWEEFVKMELNVGDALLFHAMLVHRSGTHKGGDIRWSAHFRYNDLQDEDFVRRGYPHPYVYHTLQSGK
jgi:ectoine hydroxylase-related dioxygenase (phytanoyl-CoA dioxygenase family)